MTRQRLLGRLRQRLNTLKFKVVAVTVGTAVLAALASTAATLATSKANLTRQLVEQESESDERMAVMLAGELGTLKLTLEAVAQNATLEDLANPAAAARILMSQPGLSVVFESVSVADGSGALLARVDQGMLREHARSIASCDYFRKAMTAETPIASDGYGCQPDAGTVLVVAAPVFGPGGQHVGVVVGSLALRSARLFSNIASGEQFGNARVLVINRQGTVLAHPNSDRLLGRAADEPGFAVAFAGWRAKGSPVELDGTAKLADGYLVSMAGIPTSDWMLVHIIPEAVALAPITAAVRTAWYAATGVGLASAVLAGLLAWHLTRPITRLRARAERLLTEDADHDDRWPEASGEVEGLARAFREVVAQRQRKQLETHSLLRQLQAVLNHAEVGIALTRNGQFELVSQQFCQIFKTDSARFIGESTRTIHATDAAHQALLALVRPAVAEHGTFDGEFELVRADTQPFWARIRGRVVVAEDHTQGTIWTLEDITESRAHRESLSWASSHDSLTGLSNRARFRLRLEEASVGAATHPFCVLFIDLDRFKQVNDVGGHGAGDALLRDLAAVFLAQVRKSDTVARLGGDEFAVLLDQCTLTQGEVIAEKLRTAVLAYELTWEGSSYRVGASIGLVHVDASFQGTVEILNAADHACYAAKREGRNRVAIYEAG